MNKYPIVPLGEVCDFVYGDGLKETDRKGGNIPVYGSNGIVGWHDEATTRGETIIVGRKGSIGEIHLSKIPCWAIDTTYYIDKTKVPCDFTWLYYTLKALDLTRLNKSAAVPGLNRDDAYEQKIILPPLTEQKRIASLLARADRLRQLRRTAHDLGDALLQSVFLEMFGDVKLNQKGWDIFLLEEIVKSGRIITYGIVQAGPYIEDGIPYIRTGDIKEGQIVVDGLLRTSKEIAAKYKRSEVKAGELVMSIRATVGTIAELPPQLDGANLTQGTARISPGSKVNKRFLLYAIRSQGTQKLIEDRTKGATFREITLEALREVPMIVPPLSLQEEFAGVVARVESLRGRMGESERQVEGLFESLLAEAFS